MRNENMNEPQNPQCVQTSVMQAVIASELRIGNYVYEDQSVIVKIEKLTSDKYQEWNQYEDEYCIEFTKLDDNENMFYSEVFPIPLTEEWLLKFGFKLDDGDFYELSIIKNEQVDCELWARSCMGLKIQLATCTKVKDYEQTDVRFDYIKYVHQLQNLHFSLTGRELTVA